MNSIKNILSKDLDRYQVSDSDSNSILILERKNNFKAGDILNEYIVEGDKIKINNVIFERKEFVFLNENLTPQQEKKVKEIIAKEIGRFLWNLYTKRSIFT